MNEPSFESFETTRQLAESGDPEAMFRLGYMLEFGVFVDKNVEAAVAWYRKYLNNKSDQIVSNHVDGLLAGSSSRNVSCDFDLCWIDNPDDSELLKLRLRAGQGEKAALLRLAKEYLSRNVSFGSCPSRYEEKRRLSTAAEYLQKVSSLGEPSDSAELGELLFEIGREYEANSPFSVCPWDEAIENGPSLALEFFNSAAKHGFTPALCHLAEICAESRPSHLEAIYGKITPRNEDKAISLWRTAAESGDVEAQYNLGLALWKHSPQDNCEAKQWIRKAVDSGCERAKQWLKNISKTKEPHIPLTEVIDDLMNSKGDRYAGQLQSVALGNGIDMDFVWVPGGVLTRPGLTNVRITGFGLLELRSRSNNGMESSMLNFSERGDRMFRSQTFRGKLFGMHFLKNWRSTKQYAI